MWLYVPVLAEATAVKWIAKPTFWLIIVLLPAGVYAQNGNDDPRFNDNIGVFTMSTPLNPMARFTNFGLGVDFGAGYNFTRRHAVTGELMWNWLYATDGALDPVREELQSSNIGGHGAFVALMSNYRYELRGKTFGTYFIGGPGWYHRSAELSKAIPAGTVCINPLSAWWGYNCTPGTVTTSATIASSSSSAFGVNGGIGFTVRVGDAPNRVYVEARYHYAPTKSVNTQFISIVFGFRY